MCYYSDDIIKIEDYNFDNILIDEKPYENISVYNISYKTLIGAKPLRIRSDKVKGFIRVYDGTKYLVLFSSEKYDAIYSRIRCLASQESVTTYDICRNYQKESKLISIILYL